MSADEFDDAFNLADIARRLQHLESSGGRAALELKKLRAAHAEARKALRAAKAAARSEMPALTAQGRADYIEDHVQDELYAVDLAEIAMKYGADMVEERRSERSSLQTRAKLAVESMRLAGYGGEGR